MSEVPWTVWVFAGVSVIGAIAWTVLSGNTPRALGGAFLQTALFIGLVKGYRAAHIIAIVFAATSLVGTAGFIQGALNGVPLRPQDYSAIATWLVTGALLLHPQTFAWASR